MIQFIRTFVYEILLLRALGSITDLLKLTRSTEKFDVVARVPTYTRIKHLFLIIN